MRKNKEWFSILIWMWLTILIILSAYVILAYMMPFMKSVRGIENTSWAYYQAYSWVEEGLYYTKWRIDLRTETGSTILPWESKWVTYQTYSSGKTIPQEWYGNSEYSRDFNIISQTEPIQLQVGKNYITDWDNFRFIFQIPEDLKNWNLSGGTGAIVNWMLSSDIDTLIATGSYLSAQDINIITPASQWKIAEKDWVTLWWLTKNFRTFYQESCVLVGCILKMSVVNSLKLENTTELPYLEYKIDFSWGPDVPDRYTRIESYGKAYDFQKKLNVRVPQQTINQAFDFTVFQ